MFKWLKEAIVALGDVFKHPTPPPKPHLIPYDHYHMPFGPNLVKNGSFELGPFDASVTEMVVQGSGVIMDWQVLQSPAFLAGAGGKARWIDSSHPVFHKAADGTHFVNLTGGTPPGPVMPAALYQDAALGLQPGQRYEVAIEVGVGPNNGPSANFGPPVKVGVRVIRMPDSVEQVFVCNPVNPPTGTGVTWERFYFRFAIPATYVLQPGNETITIWGQAGNYFIGVDNVSVRSLT